MSKAATPRAHHPGLVMFALAMGGFAIGTTEFATMSLLPYFSKGLGIDEPTAGHVISAYALGVVVGAPLIAVLGARFARRTQLIGMMALFAVGNALSGIAPDYHWMLLFRFLSGLPHGAYFGIASLVAITLVPPNRRATAVGRVMLGLTIATVIGVPVASWIGQLVGWRSGFAIVAALAVLTMILVAIYAPHDRPAEGASPLRELDALKKGQVWLTLAIGAIGFGGIFSVYTYFATTLMQVTHVSAGLVPIGLAVFGIGFTLGNFIVPWFADRALMPTGGGLLLFSAATLIIFPLTAPHFGLVLLNVLLIGIGGALGTVLQTRLMDVAGDAQALAAALNHSAFNTANAIGPFVGGLAIQAGYGWSSTGPVGALLALAGFLVWVVTMLDAKRREGRLATA
jgi:MFS transporter, DHA1 family, inner membrane transport protein